MQEGKSKQVAVAILSSMFTLYLAKGGLDWLPEWAPLPIMAVAALYWLAKEPQVRAVLTASFQTKTGKVLHPETHQPALLPTWRTKKAISTLAVVLLVASVIGLLAWKYRISAIAITGRYEFIFSGAYHDPNGSPEAFLATMGCSIENKTRYATGLDEWRVFLKFKDGRMVEGVSPLATDKDMPLPLIDSSSQQLTLRAGDYLPTKTMQPIPAGGETFGWFTSIFKGYTRNDVRGKGAMLILEFREIATGKQHVVRDFLDEPGRDVPGVSRFRKHLEIKGQ